MMKNLYNDDPVRIQKVIAKAGLASRRAAEDLIRAGEVLLNGKIVRQLGRKMLIGKDHLSVAGRRVVISQHQKTQTNTGESTSPANNPALPSYSSSELSVSGGGG
mgnify:CR=1 FL=1